MKKFVLILLVVLMAACKNSGETKEITVTPPPIITVEDFFKNSEQRTFRISPDGSHLAYLAPYNNRMNVHVRSMDSDSVIRVTSVVDRDIAGYFWASNDRLVYIKDDAGNENFHLFSVSKVGENEIDLTPFDGVRAQIIDDVENNEEEMIIGLNNRNPQVFDPYRININSGEMELLYENPGNITGWGTDHDGKLRVAYVTNGVDTSILYRETEADEFNEVITTDFKQTLSPQFF